MCYIETINFYAGEGNQLFVYIYGKIFSEKFNILYIHPGIPSLKIESTLHLKKKNNLNYKKINNYIKELEIKNIDKNFNYILDYGYNPTIENYKIFLPYIKFIKNMFNKPKKRDKNNLVYHLRAGDTLLCSGKNYKYLNGDKLKNIIDSIKYQKLYVVTNLKIHKPWTMNDLNNYKKKLLKYGDCGAKYNQNSLINDIEMKESLENLNKVINILNERNANWISDSIYNDFNTIISFNKIIINVSTFSWWAALLSEAKEVYVSKNWKYLKGNKNKNLPFIELDNWKAVDF